MSIQFLNINRALISSEQYRQDNNLNVDSIYSYLIVDSKVLYSEEIIVFTNTRSVYILTLHELIPTLNYDRKFIDYINITEDKLKRVLHDLAVKPMLNQVIMGDLFGLCNNVTINIDCQSEQYLLSHYLKKASKIKLREVMNDKERTKELDPDGIISSLVATKMNINLILLKRKSGEQLVWAYLNVRKDANDFYYPVLNIMEPNSGSSTTDANYDKYFVPDYILMNILAKPYPQIIDINDEDLLWSSQICPKCKFNKVSKIHILLCNYLYNKSLAF